MVLLMTATLTDVRGLSTMEMVCWQEAMQRIDDTMHIEWLMLADAAHVVSNKAYILGGGWDTLNVSSLPAQQRCAVVVAIAIPWHETNQRFHIHVDIVDEDGHRLMDMSGSLEAGRPPGLPVGQAQRLQTAVECLLTIAHPGIFAVIARINGEEHARATFRVVSSESTAR